jgi:phosphohistidine phosphatase SixA
VTVWVVRHTWAGFKEDWAGADDDRPLDSAGQEHALAIADLLGPMRPDRLRASPARRCVDTLGPLAERLDLTVDTTDDLRAGGPRGGLRAWLGTHTRPGDVVCTHGETLRPALAELRRLLPIEGDDDRLLAKGIIWELERSPVTFTTHSTPARRPAITTGSCEHPADDHRRRR